VRHDADVPRPIEWCFSWHLSQAASFQLVPDFFSDTRSALLQQRVYQR